jgi:hypothetical protein
MRGVVAMGGGGPLREHADAMRALGVRVLSAEEDDGRCPVLLGDQANAIAASHAVARERALFVCQPATLSPGQLRGLHSSRRPGQALMFGLERRYHPAYRLVAGLAQSDAAWRPRLLRHLSLDRDRASTFLMRWRAAETVALLADLLPEQPTVLLAREGPSAEGGEADFLSLWLRSGDVDLAIEVGLVEAIPRRETVLAGAGRKAYVDELNERVPVRLLDASGGAGQGVVRAVTCPPPAASELTERQCQAFLEAVHSRKLADQEAERWEKALHAWQAIGQALDEGTLTLPTPTRRPRPVRAPLLRLITG